MSGQVRFRIFELSRVHRDNGKCSFVNENVCTKAYKTSDAFKYTVAGLSSYRDLLLSKKPYAVAESEVNVG